MNPATIRTAATRISLPVLLAVALAVSGCLPGGRAGVTSGRTGKPIRLSSVEIRQYKGKRLDSVADMRENSIQGPQDINLASYRMRISGEVTSPLTLTYNEVIDAQHYSKVVTLYCVEGWNVRILWEGVRLSDLLARAGYHPDAKTVIFRCKDGYTTSLPLDYVAKQDILLAYKMNGIDLPKERGFPFQVVAQDKWGYKWAKWITDIEVSDDANYRGYWEQRGYENSGDLQK